MTLHPPDKDSWLLKNDMPLGPKAPEGLLKAWFGEQRHEFTNILTGKTEEFRLEGGGKYLTSGGTTIKVTERLWPSLDMKPPRESASKRKGERNPAPGSLNFARNIWAENAPRKGSKALDMGLGYSLFELGKGRRRRR